MHIAGEENVPFRILDEVCANILENAKEVFQAKVDQSKKLIRGKSPGQVNTCRISLHSVHSGLAQSD